MLKILVTPPVNEKHKAMLTAACPDGEFTYIQQKELVSDDVRDADVIIGNIPHALVPECRSLKLLHLNMAGADGYPELMPEDAVLANSSGAYGLANIAHSDRQHDGILYRSNSSLIMPERIHLIIIIRIELLLYREQLRKHMLGYGKSVCAA